MPVSTSDVKLRSPCELLETSVVQGLYSFTMMTTSWQRFNAGEALRNAVEQIESSSNDGNCHDGLKYCFTVSYLLNINRAPPEVSYRAERYSVKTKHIHTKAFRDHDIVKRAAELNMTVSEYTTAGRY